MPRRRTGRLGSLSSGDAVLAEDFPPLATCAVGEAFDAEDDPSLVDSPGFFSVGRLGSLSAAGGVPDEVVLGVGVELELPVLPALVPPLPEELLEEELLEEDPLDPERWSTG
ncbi:MAG TPA: hypothetical protein VKG79_05480, partial [Bryobacteraceae bacterium]|nr:hypothetical protein [Bryobacteraceae bacterium]